MTYTDLIRSCRHMLVSLTECHEINSVVLLLSKPWKVQEKYVISWRKKTWLFASYVPSGSITLQSMLLFVIKNMFWARNTSVILLRHAIDNKKGLWGRNWKEPFLYRLTTSIHCNKYYTKKLENNVFSWFLEVYIGKKLPDESTLRKTRKTTWARKVPLLCNQSLQNSKIKVSTYKLMSAPTAAAIFLLLFQSAVLKRVQLQFLILWKMWNTKLRTIQHLFKLSWTLCTEFLAAPTMKCLPYCWAMELVIWWRQEKFWKKPTLKCYMLPVYHIVFIALRNSLNQNSNAKINL